MGQILICDDEATTRESARRFLEAAGLAVDSVSSGEECLKRYDSSHQVVILDLGLPGISGLETLAQLRNNNPKIKVIIMTSNTDAKSVVSAFRSGASNYVTKPFRPTELVATVKELLSGSESPETPIAGELTSLQSPAMRQVLGTVEKLKESLASVLIVGETGTGKEILAKHIHRLSQREGKFVAVNCPAIPLNLAEAELFGYERGAFTGAVQRRDGKITTAHGGTLFLDEVADLAIEVQAKLLRVLQEREVEPIGSRTAIPVQIRVIAATSRDLRALIQEGRFREDLYYRLCDVECRMPPLREHLNDLPDLVDFFANELAAETKVAPTQFTSGAILRLQQHSWPGNVRELRGITRRLILMSGGLRVDEGLIERESFLKTSHTFSQTALTEPNDLPFAKSSDSLEASDFSIEANEKKLIEAALISHRFHLTETAKALGMGRTTLYRKMKKYGL